MWGKPWSLHRGSQIGPKHPAYLECWKTVCNILHHSSCALCPSRFAPALWIRPTVLRSLSVDWHLAGWTQGVDSPAVLLKLFACPITGLRNWVGVPFVASIESFAFAGPDKERGWCSGHSLRSTRSTRSTPHCFTDVSASTATTVRQLFLFLRTSFNSTQFNSIQPNSTLQSWQGCSKLFQEVSSEFRGSHKPRNQDDLKPNVPARHNSFGITLKQIWNTYHIINSKLNYKLYRSYKSSNMQRLGTALAAWLCIILLQLASSFS